MTEIICAAIAAVSAVMVAVIGSKTTQEAKKNEARAAMRKRENLLSLELMNANTELTVAIANAVLGGHNNGNVEEARHNVDVALKAYKDFHDELVAEKIAK